MTISATDFISAFPEFSNNSVFPLSQINFWIPQAYNNLNADCFGQSLDLAVMLFVAHNIVPSARAAAVANVGGIPGEATGPISSKGVDKVSVGYDTAATQIPGAGAWNGTSYGQRLYRMMVAVAAGGLYVPGSCSQPAWPSGVGWPDNIWSVQ